MLRMMNQTINILCSTDENYVPYCGVMLTSLFESNKENEIHVYVLLDKPLSSRSQNKFSNLARRYSNTINYILVDSSFLKKFPIKGNSYWSIATYYRIYAAELLPETIDKILYLDCDIIVDGSLEHLWSMDLSDYAAGVVPDICTEMQENYKRLEYNASLGYFNAGVLMMNLRYWREHSVGRECLEYLEHHYDSILWNDQDVLNYVLRNNKMKIPVTYNYQIKMLLPTYYETFNEVMKRDIENTLKPIIIHYATPTKPWMINYYPMPFNNVWHKYKRVSPWRHRRDLLPDHKRLNYIIKRFLLWPINIKNETGFLRFPLR